MEKLNQFISFYNSILIDSEKELLEKIAPVIDKGENAFCSAFIARYDTKKASEIFLRALKSHHNNCDIFSLSLLSLALESVFIRSQNTEILQTGYSFLTQNYDLVCKSTKDSEENFAFAVLCDKLRFFSSALNLNDKAKFIKKRDETVEKCNFDNSCFALSPLYLMAYEPSFAHAQINATTLCLPTCEKDFLGFYFALHGLYTYGYDDIATAWKNTLYRSITTPLLDPTSLAILGEIILLN